MFKKVLTLLALLILCGCTSTSDRFLAEKKAAQATAQAPKADPVHDYSIESDYDAHVSGAIKGAKFNFSLTKNEYSHGYLTLAGTVKNTGIAIALSPVIKVEVYGDKVGKVLLAESRAMIAGQYLKQMAPGVEAGFESITKVPGAPKDITYSYWVEH